MVFGLLAFCYRQRRDLRAEFEAETLEIGSYQTVWAILHRLRSVLIRPDREHLCGTVEVDETYIGGKESGLSGGRAKGKKILTCIAIEILEPKGFGRCRMAPVADASSESLRSFVLDNVEPGATVITDAWQGYRWLEKNGYIHDRRSQRAASTRGEDPGELLPGVHRIASLAKRWLLGTHQGAVDSAHLPSYLDVWTPQTSVIVRAASVACLCALILNGCRRGIE